MNGPDFDLFLDRAIYFTDILDSWFLPGSKNILPAPEGWNRSPSPSSRAATKRSFDVVVDPALPESRPTEGLVEGSEATALAEGMDWSCRPRYSPEGEPIAFISDREVGMTLGR